MIQAAKKLYATVFLLCGAILFAQEQGSVYIREFTGTVEVKAPGAADWSAAQTGQALSRDTMISTGFKSTAFVALGNSTLVVRPLTRLTLQEIQNIQGDESVSINLQSGRVRADVKPPEGGVTSFIVQSPMVTASVRGTSFDFDGLNLHVGEGTVHVSGGDGTGVYVGAGHRIASNPQTGRTDSPTETFKAELTPTPPAGTTAPVGAATPAGTAAAPPAAPGKTTPTPPPDIIIPAPTEVDFILELGF
jgi:hypothetical protein